MRTRGVYTYEPRNGVRPLWEVPDRQAILQEVAWDGEQVWLFMDNKNGTNELLVLDRRGQVVRRWTSEEGLPSSTYVLVRALAAGRLLGVGTHRGRRPRSWVAMFSLQGTNLFVDVFHESPRALAFAEQPSKHETTTPRDAMWPALLCLLTTNKPFQALACPRRGNPWLIDCDERSVKVVPARITARGPVYEINRHPCWLTKSSHLGVLDPKTLRVSYKSRGWPMTADDEVGQIGDLLGLRDVLLDPFSGRTWRMPMDFEALCRYFTSDFHGPVVADAEGKTFLEVLPSGQGGASGGEGQVEQEGLVP